MFIQCTYKVSTRLLTTYMCTCAVEFEETPVSLTVTIGAESRFRCRHPSADAIAWRINNTYLNVLQDGLHNLLYGLDSGQTLSVTADPQLNMSSIQCVAVFIGGPVISVSPVTLKIQGVFNILHVISIILSLRIIIAY